MPTWTTLSLFLLAALGLLFIPGPAVLFIMTRSVDQARRAGAISSLGIGAASLIHTTAAAFGLSALLITSALALSVVKYLGAASLMYPGIRTFLRREEPHRPQRADQKTQAFPTSPTLCDGWYLHCPGPDSRLCRVREKRILTPI